MEQEALCLAQRRRNTQLEPVHGDDARDTSTDIGDARKHDKGVLDVADSRNHSVGDEDEDDGHQADGASHALHQNQRLRLSRRQRLGAAGDQLVRRLRHGLYIV